jgi:hypothetical protein
LKGATPLAPAMRKERNLAAKKAEGEALSNSSFRIFPTNKTKIPNFR